MEMAKGQAVSLDLFFAIVILFLVFIVFVDQNNLNINYSAEEIIEKDMKRAVSTAANNLVLTQGTPKNWEFSLDSQILLIGLVNTRRVIAENKLDEFMNMNYDISVKRLGIHGYDYYFSIEQKGIIVKEKYNTANPAYLSDSEKIAVTKRMVEYNGEISELYFKIYW